jgi:hypothetical protein
VIEYRVIWWERLADVAEPVAISGIVYSKWDDVVYTLDNIRANQRTAKAFIEARPASDSPWPRFWDSEVVA